jgi:hypothetical protein
MRQKKTFSSVSGVLGKMIRNTLPHHLHAASFEIFRDKAGFTYIVSDGQTQEENPIFFKTNPSFKTVSDSCIT